MYSKAHLRNIGRNIHYYIDKISASILSNIYILYKSKSEITRNQLWAINWIIEKLETLVIQ